MKDVKTVFEIISKLNYVMTRRQKIESVFIIVMIFIGAILEMLGVSIIVPFIYALLSPEVIVENKYLQPVLSFLNFENTQQIIIFFTVMMMLVYFCKNLFLLILSYVQIRFRNRLLRDLSVKILDAYMLRPYTYFLNVNSSEVLRGITSDVNSVSNILGDIFNILVQGLSVTFIAVYLLFTDVLLACGVVLVALFCLITFVFVVKRNLMLMGIKVREATARQYKVAYQAIHGIKEIKVLKRTKYFKQDYESAYEEKMKVDVSNEFIMSCPEKIIETICVVGFLGILIVRIIKGIDLVNFIPSLAAFSIGAFKLLPSISRIAGYISGIIYGKVALYSTYNNLKEVEEFREEYKETKQYLLPINQEKNIRFNEKFELTKISWKYENSQENVLDNLSLTVRKGESIGIIGTSGVGKTTLADVILGLLPPQNGTVLIDNHEISAVLEGWSNIIGYIPQSVFLVDDTIRNNVAFGISKAEIDDEMVWNALEQAQIKAFVEKLPQKLDTMVGERGIRFSGGQRQRVAIARALYGNPNIIIMDEATSALDNETEKALMESIEELQHKKTLIIIAHRLSTIRNCDKIYEVKDGGVCLKNINEILIN